MGETVRLALGAFLTSSGFGGLAALVAAAVAYYKLRTDLEAAQHSRRAAEDVRRAERKAAQESEQRSRWLSAFLWLSQEHDAGRIDDEGWLDGLLALQKLVTTAEQRAMLAVAERVSGGDGDDAAGESV